MYPGFSISADGKICLENYSYPTFSKCIPSIFWDSYLGYNINTLIRMSNFDDKYRNYQRVCDSLPESFCRGAIIDISNVKLTVFCLIRIPLL